MGHAGRLRRRYTRFATIVFVGSGVVSAVLWALASVISPGSPIAELPQMAALTFVLGALALSATSRAGAFVQGRTGERDQSVRWPSIVMTSGICYVTLSVLLSLLLLSNGVLYFALDRAWPITPRRAGLVQFYVLAAMVLVPTAVSLLALSFIVASRIRPGAG